METPSFNDEGLITEFNAVRMYDAPGVLLKQIMDDEVSYESLKNLVTNTSALSQAERDSVNDIAKEHLGGTRFGNTLVDVVMNPFTWLLFVTSPAAGSSMKNSGRVFTSSKTEVSDDLVKYAVNNASVLKQAGLLGANHLTSGTALPAIINRFTRRVHQITEEEMSGMRIHLDPLLESISKRFGVRQLKSLDPEDAPDIPELREFLKKANVFAYAHMSGLDVGGLRKSTDIVEGHYYAINKRVDNVNPITGEVTRELEPHAMSVNVTDDQYREIESLRKTIATEKDPEFLSSAHQALRKLETQILPSGEFRLSTAMSRADVDFLENQRQIAVPRKKPKEGEVLRSSDFLVQDVGKVTEGVYTTRTTQDEIYGLDNNQHMKSWLEDNGFMPFIEQSRAQMKMRYADLFADADLFRSSGMKDLVLDENKIARMYRAIRRDAKMSDSEVALLSEREGWGVIGDLLGDDILDNIRSGRISKDGLMNVLKKTRESDDLTYYMPRNVHSYASIEDGQLVHRRVDAQTQVGGEKRAQASGRARTKSVHDSRINTDDLRIIRDHLNKSESDNLDAVRIDNDIRKFEGGIKKKIERGVRDNRVNVRDLDFSTSTRKYLKSTRNDVALFADEISPDVKAALEDFRPIRTRPSPKDISEQQILGGGSLYDLMDEVGRELRLSGDPYSEKFIRGPLLSRMTGVMPLNDFLGNSALNFSQRALHGLANSEFMKKVGDTSDTARNFTASLRAFTNKDLHESAGSKVGRGVTGVFYGSTLGLNVGSAALNLFQPMLFAQGWMGMDNMVKGYGQAIKQYFGYMADRVKLPVLKGLNNDEMQQVEDLRRKHFRLSDVDGDDLLDIRKSTFEMLDSVAFTSSGSRSVSGTKFWLSEMPMKLFSHSEIFNRVVTGEAMLATMRKAGRALGDESKAAFDLAEGVPGTIAGVRTNRFLGSDKEVARSTDNIRQMVQNTQYGSDIMNSPQLFQSSAMGLPWMRQFFTFPVRTLTALTDSTRMVNAGEREWGLLGLKTGNPLLATAHDTMRLLGVSALIYEGGKGALGLDFSKGLATESLYESTIVGPYLMGDDPSLPLPPLLDSVKGVAEAMLEGDKGVMGEVLSRLTPGGVGIAKALRLAPQLVDRTSTFAGMQTQYADWTKVDQMGRVPVFKADGSMLELRSAPQLILGSMGLDRYMFQNEKEMNQYIMKNREASVDFRRRYVDSLLGNDPSKAARIKREYENKYKIPLTVTKAQIDSSITRREVPTRERMLSSLPKNLRPQFAEGLVSVGGVVSQNVDEAMLGQKDKRMLQQQRTEQAAP